MSLNITLTAFKLVHKELLSPYSNLSNLLNKKIITIEEIAYGVLLFDRFSQMTTEIIDTSKIIYIIYVAIYIAHKVLVDAYASLKTFSKNIKVTNYSLQFSEIKFLKTLHYNLEIPSDEFDVSMNIIKSFFFI